MDSLTQAVLGASVAGICAPPGYRRKALLVGALLGTLPDTDVFIDYGGPVENFTRHRGFSHSLFVLAPLSVLLFMALRSWWAPVRAEPSRWFAAIFLALLTHPLLDAHTAYGTQLWWPLEVTPAMWSTMFIIDPAFTLPLLIAVLVAAWKPAPSPAGRALAAGIVLGSLYLGWSWAAKLVVEHNARQALAAGGLQDVPMFTTPTPLNTLLWRIVVLTDEGYLEGFDSLVVDEPALELVAHRSDVRSLQQASHIPAVARLRWFADDFVRADVVDGHMLISDLRMGQEPVYVFRHLVAERGNPRWQPIEPERLPIEWADRALAQTWQRIWAE